MSPLNSFSRPDELQLRDNSRLRRRGTRVSSTGPRPTRWSRSRLTSRSSRSSMADGSRRRSTVRAFPFPKRAADPTQSSLVVRCTTTRRNPPARLPHRVLRPAPASLPRLPRDRLPSGRTTSRRTPRQRQGSRAPLRPATSSTPALASRTTKQRSPTPLWPSSDYSTALLYSYRSLVSA